MRLLLVPPVCSFGVEINLALIVADFLVRTVPCTGVELAIAFDDIFMIVNGF